MRRALRARGPSDPGEFLSDTVPVYIDPADPRRYLFDTSVLPSPGNVPDPDEPE